MSIDVATLLAGPRGRRLALEHALATAEGPRPDGDGEPDLRLAVMRAAHRLDPNPGTMFLAYLSGEQGPHFLAEPAVPSPDDVAVLLDDLPWSAPDLPGLLETLDRVVSFARYWQEPDGDDVLAATPVVRAALARIAEHLVASPLAVWWSEGLARGTQRVVRWAEDPVPAGPEGAAEKLEQWRLSTTAREERALRDRPTDPEARWSGEWWSTPPRTLMTTTRSLGPSGPVGLWLMEDSPGWDRATVHPAGVPDAARVFEIDGPDAWARLCRRHPLDVTGEKRQDWYRTTGRAGDWVIPDWSAVAHDYDAVHLTVAGYLTAAGTAITVGDTTVSVIAGWAPDETFWLTDVIGAGVDLGVEGENWVRDDDRGWLTTGP